MRTLTRSILAVALVLSVLGCSGSMAQADVDRTLGLLKQKVSGASTSAATLPSLVDVVITDDFSVEGGLPYSDKEQQKIDSLMALAPEVEWAKSISPDSVKIKGDELVLTGFATVEFEKNGDTYLIKRIVKE